jgi:hypothetical protein
MQIQFRLSLEDYIAAQSLHATRSAWPLFMYLLPRFIYPILGILFLIWDVSSMVNQGLTAHVAWLIICAVILICIPFYVRFQLKRCYRRTRSGSGDCTVTFGEERIEMKGEFSSSEMDWKGVKSFVENDKLFLLYIASAKFFPVPKRVCSEAEISTLRALLLQKVKSGTHL